MTDLRRDTAPMPETPDPLALAAWLDGGCADAAESAAVEAALAADPGLLAALVAARAAAAVPEVPQPAVLAAARRGVPAAAPAWRTPAAAAIAASLALIVAAGGVSLGAGIEDIQHRRFAAAAADVLDLLAPTGGEAEG